MKINQNLKQMAEQYCEANLIDRGSFDEMIAEKAFNSGYVKAIEYAIKMVEKFVTDNNCWQSRYIDLIEQLK